MLQFVLGCLTSIGVFALVGVCLFARNRYRENRRFAVVVRLSVAVAILVGFLTGFSAWVFVPALDGLGQDPIYLFIVLGSMAVYILTCIFVCWLIAGFFFARAMSGGFTWLLESLIPG